MSGAGPQRGLETVNGKSMGRMAAAPRAHLLHALNQPLTGLQCSLELAVAGLHSAEHYIRTLREGLELTHSNANPGRSDPRVGGRPRAQRGKDETILLDDLVSDALDDLIPVAEAKQCDSRVCEECSPPAVCSQPTRVGDIALFRLS